jgi:hypothetical protein
MGKGRDLETIKRGRLGEREIQPSQNPFRAQPQTTNHPSSATLVTTSKVEKKKSPFEPSSPYRFGN